MGDVTDMMLEGILCEGCGVLVGDAVGYPRLCDDCSAEDMEQHDVYARCSRCGKKVKRDGLEQHQEAKHNER